MNFPFRRKPLALLFYYGFASMLVGACVTEALAQGVTPLRVDPVLLGMPPMNPAEAPAPAVQPVPQPAPVETPVETPRVEASPIEVKPVEEPVADAPAVEAAPEEVLPKKASKPVKEPKASVQEIPARAVVPQPKPAIAASSPAPVPAAAELPAAIVPTRTQNEDEQEAAPVVSGKLRSKQPEPLLPAPVVVPAAKPEQPVQQPAVITPRETEQKTAPVAVAKPAVEKAEKPEKSISKQPEPLPQAPVAASPAKPVSPVQQPAPSVAEFSPASSRVAFSSLAPLRVDPALLGSPPVKAVSVASPPVLSQKGASQPVAVPAVQAAHPSVAPVSPAKASPAIASAATTSPAMASAATASVPTAAKKPETKAPWYERMWDTVTNPYYNGDLEFYLPLETYHSRTTYSAEQIASYQEQPLGLGLGLGLYNEKGNWEGLFAMAFQDSHFKPSYTAGYQWKAIWRPAEDVRLGLGYLAGLMAREDTLNYFPFPIVVPVASVAYKNFSLEGTYIPPGGSNGGNVLFFWAKWELGKKGQAIGTPAPRPEPVAVAPEMVNSSFGASTPIAYRRLPFGPDLDIGAESLAAGNVPPQVTATGIREEEEVPDVAPALVLHTSKSMEPLPKDSAVPRPIFLSAQRMGGSVEKEFIAEEDAELRKIGTVVNADRLTYWPIDDEVEAEGNVRLEQGEDRISGPKMRLKLEDQVGFFEQPAYFIKRQPAPGSKSAAENAFAAKQLAQQNEDDWLNSGFETPAVLDLAPGQTILNDSTKMGRQMTEGRGEADRINFEGENQVRMTNGTYTTCAPGNDDWYLKTETLKLDYDREVGEGTDGTVHFLGMPIFYTPWLSFSLNHERKSGFLPPSFGTNSDSGFLFSLPYYWNIAPNMDATITPHVMTKRGVLFDNEYRYLDTALGGVYRGQVRAEYLPSDKLLDGDNRYAVSLQHTQTAANGFSGSINYNKVSDDTYLTDLSTSITASSATQLLQQGVLSYGGGGWWNATANFQQYQTLQPDPANPVLEPYKMLPQFTFNARKPDWNMTDSSLMGQYTNFTRTDQSINGVKVNGPDGQRTVLYPQVSVPFVTPGWYVTPKVGVNIRNYALSGQAQDVPGSQSSTLPIFSVDSGMTFERPSNWFGRDYTQTLEPRLYYLNIPYKDQSQIPIFDSGVADFNFAQIFSENQFSGWDRINNANQLTVAATTRLIEPESGIEIMRAMIGERFSFTQNKVGLAQNLVTTADDNTWDKSDLLAAFSGQILPKVYADTALQYNFSDQQFMRYSLGMRYQPEPGKVINAAYRYNRDVLSPINQVDLSGQWPLSGRWHAVGRINYSFDDESSVLSGGSQSGRMIESIAGLEYNGGCWVVRGVVHQTALTEDSKSSAFFIQLELSDFSRIGSNPLNLLKRNIQGYSLINQSAADPAFDE